MEPRLTKPTVFVSSSVDSLPLVKGLEEALSHDARVVMWADAPFSLAQPPLAQLSRSASAADFVVVLVDLGGAAAARKAVQSRPRDNLLFELGFLIGSVGSDRVLIVDITPTRRSVPLPSDLAGLTVLRAGPGKADHPRELSRQVADEVRRRIRHVEPKEQSTTAASYSCFISYSHLDEPLASKLYDDLNAVGARCWIDRHELRVGDSLLDHVSSALSATDKFLPILSSAAIHSPWCETELRKALELERRRAATIVLPIRVDDAVFSAQGGPWNELRNRLIADFRNWRSDVAYRTAFRHLALNLAVSASEDRTAEPRE